MKLEEIINLVEKYKKNPDIINDRSYIEEISKIIMVDTNSFSEDALVYLNTIIDIFSKIISTPKLLDNYIDNDAVLLIYLILTSNNLKSIPEKYYNRILEFIRDEKINSFPDYKEILGNENLFELVAKLDKSLLRKFNIPAILGEITSSNINEYSQEILGYIEDVPENNLSYLWLNNKILFDFLKENRRDLLYKMNLEAFFPEITEEILNEYQDIILKYIKRSDYFPISWENSKILFDYLKENKRDFLYKMNLGLFFPEITPEILDEYGDVIINAFTSPNPALSMSWGAYPDSLLFNYIKEKRRDLLPNLYLCIAFKEITPEILDEYGDIILEHISRMPSGIFIEWAGNKILFNYLKEKRPDLLYKMDLEKLFPEITEEILNDYSEAILKYLEKNPYSIPEKWKNSIVLIQYLNRNKKQLLDNFYIQDLIFDDEYLENFAKFYGIDKDKLTIKIRYLYTKNNELFNTLNFDMLKIDGLSLNLLSKFTLYPSIQEKILSLDDITLSYFIKIANTLNIEDYDLTGAIEKVLNNINNYEYLLSKIPISELDNEHIKNLAFVLERSSNIFNINSIDDLTDIGFKKKREEYLKNISNNLENMSIVELRSIIFEKLYGIDYELAETIYNRYCHKLEDLQDMKIDSVAMNTIMTIKKVMEADSLEILKTIYQNTEICDAEFNLGIFVEAKIRKEFAKMYKDTLYHIRSEDKSKDPILQNVIYNGKKIEFYEVNGDFNMQIHGIGSYGDWQKPRNFKEDWITPRIACHGICTSYIGNNQIATAPPVAPFLGFTDYEDSALLLAGNFDLGSVNMRFSITNEGTKSNFLTPKDMINGTRHNHNEMVIERMIPLEDGTLIKRMPSYIVYLVDDMNNQDNFSDSNEYYQMILQAAADFNIPVVIIDRLKVCKRELKKCLNLEKEFLETHDSKVLEELFLTYMNNAVGCRKFDGYEEKEYHNIFDETVIREFYKRIYTYLKEECDNLDNNNVQKLGDNLVTLLRLLIHEQQSYALSHKSYRLNSYIDLDLEIENVKKLLEEYKKKVRNIPNITIENIEENHIMM